MPGEEEERELVGDQYLPQISGILMKLTEECYQDHPRDDTDDGGSCRKGQHAITDDFGNHENGNKWP